MVLHQLVDTSVLELVNGDIIEPIRDNDDVNESSEDD